MSAKNVVSGLRIGSLRKLRIIIEKWQLMNSETSLLEEQDAPWWYNERATLSFFAGAIWQSQGWVLEEFSTSKLVTTKQQKHYKTGRCDILFNVQNEKFIAEAKQCWPTLVNNLHAAIQSVHDTLDTACKEALDDYEKEYTCLGMVFITPMLHISKNERIEEYLQNFVSQLLEIKETTVAWVFPKAARNLRPDNELQNHNYIFPGVALVIRRAGKY